MKPFSVLLLYPDYIATDYGTETYYAHVRAKDPVHAVAKAQREAAKFNDQPAARDDFAPLLVLAGHIQGEEFDEY